MSGSTDSTIDSTKAVHTRPLRMLRLVEFVQEYVLRLVRGIALFLEGEELLLRA
jgi:hypothetical protein